MCPRAARGVPGVEQDVSAVRLQAGLTQVVAGRQDGLAPAHDEDVYLVPGRRGRSGRVALGGHRPRARASPMAATRSGTAR